MIDSLDNITYGTDYIQKCSKCFKTFGYDFEDITTDNATITKNNVNKENKDTLEKNVEKVNANTSVSRENDSGDVFIKSTGCQHDRVVVCTECANKENPSYIWNYKEFGNRRIKSGVTVRVENEKVSKSKSKSKSKDKSKEIKTNKKKEK